ncbi:uncharacterized protein LOC108733243 [Agrilus planipennis]|uniref:Uncharacterized protein LOC108733243 n=1 Tax=Agrilus planipennis TaxID=224129 RepID=A0A1W4WIJ4_AGRPL|nr:uncharacterized protein LOC108733243 [Agrilus planipennis]XP_018319835.1 uncharacterized protein LOC108733243 [Agrilus planipennis]XP_025836041.1 uncharacterized protein LOC108733243 [Agrilus planipennis]
MWFGTILKAIACWFLLSDCSVLTFPADGSVLKNNADYPVAYSPRHGYASKFSGPGGFIKIRRINEVEGGDNSPLVRGMFEEEYEDGGKTKKSKVFYKSESGYSSSSFDTGTNGFNERFPDFNTDEDSFFTDDIDNSKKSSRPDDPFNMDFFKVPNNDFIPSNVMMPYARPSLRPNYQQPSVRPAYQQPSLRPTYQQQYIYPNYG